MKALLAIAMMFALTGGKLALAEVEEQGINENPGVCENKVDGAAEITDEAGGEASQGDSWHQPRLARHLWHCQAYPNHSGHGHSHDAYSRFYWQAYQRALNSCQYYHGYGRCHVHCHVDRIH